MVERQPSKLNMPVRSRSPAPVSSGGNMKQILTAICIIFITALPAFAGNHDHAAAAKSTKISDRVYVIQVSGGNIGVSIGDDGIFMIDNGYANATPQVLEQIEKITGTKENDIRYVLNTHWHGDHTGGNEVMGGQGAMIMSHDNVRKRLSVDNYIPAFDMKSTAAPAIALPSLTFNDHMHVHINGDTLSIMHLPNAHTDGDSVIYFEKDNIMHTGDIFFNGFYPFIDASTGGSFQGMIDATNVILEKINDQTKIIPGHGPLSNKAELTAYRDMLVSVQSAIKPMIEAGKTLEEITAANPLKSFNEEWGDGFLPPEKWLPIAYESMKQ